MIFECWRLLFSGLFESPVSNDRYFVGLVAIGFVNKEKPVNKNRQRYQSAQDTDYRPEKPEWKNCRQQNIIPYDPEDHDHNTIGDRLKRMESHKFIFFILIYQQENYPGDEKIG